jgi:hypothetical protein
VHSRLSAQDRHRIGEHHAECWCPVHQKYTTHFIKVNGRAVCVACAVDEAYLHTPKED